MSSKKEGNIKGIARRISAGLLAMVLMASMLLGSSADVLAGIVAPSGDVKWAVGGEDSYARYGGDTIITFRYDASPGLVWGCGDTYTFDDTKATITNDSWVKADLYGGLLNVDKNAFASVADLIPQETMEVKWLIRNIKGDPDFVLVPRISKIQFNYDAYDFNMIYLNENEVSYKPEDMPTVRLVYDVDVTAGNKGKVEFAGDMFLDGESDEAYDYWRDQGKTRPEAVALTGPGKHIMEKDYLDYTGDNAVTNSKVASTTQAVVNEEKTFTVTPDSGYVVDAVTAKIGEEDVSSYLTKSGNQYKLNLPEEKVKAADTKVKVNATFKQATPNPNYTIEHYVKDLTGSGYTKVYTETKNDVAVGDSASSDAAITSGTHGGIDFSGVTFESSNANNVLSGTVPAAGSLTLKRYYTRKDVTLTLVPNEGTASVTPETITDKYGAPLSLPTPTNSNASRNFAGWFKDSATTAGNEAGTTMPPANANLYAKWTNQATYTVTFDSKGGNYTPAPQTVEAGKKVVKPADPIKTNNNFKGWYKDAGLSQAYDFNDPVTSALTLHAKWESNNDPIRPVKDPTDIKDPGVDDPKAGEEGGFVVPGDNGHDDNGTNDDKVIVPNPNTDANEKAEVDKDGDLVLPDGGFIDDNKNGNKDGGETALPPSIVDKDGKVVKYLAYIRLLDNATSSALTTPAGYKTRLEVAAGSNAVAAVPSINNYDYVNATPSNRTIDAATLAAATKKNEIKLFYKKKAGLVSVTYVTNGGTAIDATNPQVVTSGQKVVSPMTTYAGHSFAGWYEKKDFSGNMFNFNTPITKDTTLYAKWSSTAVKTHTVTFNSQGGSTVKSQKVLDQGYVVEPKSPTRSGYTFSGWYTAATGGTKYNFANNNNKITSNKTLYARWTAVKKKTVTITKYNVLLSKAVPTKTKSVKISWKKISGATKYVVYGSRCNYYKKGKLHQCKMKKMKTLSSSKAAWTKNSLSKKTYYKFKVVAYKGNKKLATSKTAHVVTGKTKGKYGTVKSVKTSKKAITISLGKTYKIKGKKTTVYGNKTCMNRNHCDKYRYSRTSNVVSVSSSGVIKGLKKGTATVYTIGVNGYWYPTKVTVK